MLISEITIGNRKEIDTIHLHLTRELVQFLQNTDGTSIRAFRLIFYTEKRTSRHSVLNLPYKQNKRNGGKTNELS